MHRRAPAPAPTFTRRVVRKQTVLNQEFIPAAAGGGGGGPTTPNCGAGGGDRPRPRSWSKPIVLARPPPVDPLMNRLAATKAALEAAQEKARPIFLAAITAKNYIDYNRFMDEHVVANADVMRLHNIISDLETQAMMRDILAPP